MAGLFFMGSFGVGCLAGAEYGKWVGLSSFVVLAALGVFLHISADRIQKTQETSGT